MSLTAISSVVTVDTVLLDVTGVSEDTTLGTLTTLARQGPGAPSIGVEIWAETTLPDLPFLLWRRGYLTLLARPITMG